MSITIADDVIAAIAKKGTIQNVIAEHKKNPKALEFAKKLNADGSLLFQRKGKVPPLCQLIFPPFR